MGTVAGEGASRQCCSLSRPTMLSQHCSNIYGRRAEKDKNSGILNQNHGDAAAFQTLGKNEPHRK